MLLKRVWESQGPSLRKQQHTSVLLVGSLLAGTLPGQAGLSDWLGNL